MQYFCLYRAGVISHRKVSLALAISHARLGSVETSPRSGGLLTSIRGVDLGRDVLGGIFDFDGNTGSARRAAN